MKLSRKDALIEKINSIGEFDEKDRGVAPVSYSDAVKRLKKREKDIEDACAKHREETLKDTEEMGSTEDARLNQKVVKTPELKKMHLSESLFEEWEDEEEEEVEEETCECEKIEEAVHNPIDEYLEGVMMGEGYVSFDKIEQDLEFDETLKGAEFDDIIDRALETGWKIKKLPTAGPSLVQKGHEVVEESLEEGTRYGDDIYSSDTDKLRDFFADTIVGALDNIFTVAVSETGVKQSDVEYDPLKIDNAIATLAEELTKAFLGVDKLEEAKSKHDTVIKAALRRKEGENKKLTEDLDTNQPESKGVADILNDLIIDEFEAITGYNNAISTITSIDPESTMLNVLNDIINEENTHVGQLQAALKEVSEAADNIMSGNNEGEGQLGNPEVEVQEPVPEERSSFEDEHIG